MHERRLVKGAKASRKGELELKQCISLRYRRRPTTLPIFLREITLPPICRSGFIPRSAFLFYVNLHYRGRSPSSRGIQKVAADLRAAIFIDVADPAQRDQWPLEDRALPTSETKLRGIRPKGNKCNHIIMTPTDSTASKFESKLSQDQTGEWRSMHSSA